MNQKFKILSVIFLIAIYLNALGHSYRSLYYDGNINPINTLNLKFFEDLKVRLIATISQSFIDFKDLKNERLLNCDRLLHGLKSILKQSLHSKLKSISLYISDSKNIIIKYRKQNYIYPYHYFW